MTLSMTTFQKVGSPTNIKYDQEFLQGLPCGLHRATLREAYELLPEFSELYDSALANCPDVNLDDWFIDLKIHMLMKGQFPCIPNWHCDNVPRVNGEVAYDRIKDNVPPMYLWISNGPCTEFVEEDWWFPPVKSHGELDSYIREKNIPTKSIEPQQWISMLQNTPHRGKQTDKYSWRVFARLIHKSIDTARPVVSKLRRHAQVYLPANFHW